LLAAGSAKTFQELRNALPSLNLAGFDYAATSSMGISNTRGILWKIEVVVVLSWMTDQRGNGPLWKTDAGCFQDSLAKKFHVGSSTSPASGGRGLWGAALQLRKLVWWGTWLPWGADLLV